MLTELDKHIARLILLGLSNQEISVVLHLPQLTILDRIANLMDFSGAYSRQDFVTRLSTDPQFQQWFRLVNSSQAEYAEGPFAGARG
jgi:DNA-binding CsgD family transcriptional regulator